MLELGYRGKYFAHSKISEIGSAKEEGVMEVFVKAAAGMNDKIMLRNKVMFHPLDIFCCYV